MVAAEVPGRSVSHPEQTEKNTKRRTEKSR